MLGSDIRATAACLDMDSANPKTNPDWLGSDSPIGRKLAPELAEQATIPQAQNLLLLYAVPLKKELAAEHFGYTPCLGDAATGREGWLRIEDFTEGTCATFIEVFVEAAEKRRE